MAAQVSPSRPGQNCSIDMNRYTRAVIAIEWPAQAEGHVVRAGDRYLDDLQGLAINLKPASQAATFHALLLQSLMRLRDARQERLLAAETTIPGIVWMVVIVGGAITIAFSSFLGAPSVRMHLGMCCLLAVSGALVLGLIIALSNPFRGDSASPRLRSTTSSRIGGAP